MGVERAVVARVAGAREAGMTVAEVVEVDSLVEQVLQEKKVVEEQVEVGWVAERVVVVREAVGSVEEG